jgi:hypothetical protein
MQMSKEDLFWDKVEKCKHEHKSNFDSMLSCFCNQAIIFHCLDCGVYGITDPCNEISGQSGWSPKRWETYHNKKMKKYLNNFSLTKVEITKAKR